MKDFMKDYKVPQDLIEFLNEKINILSSLEDRNKYSYLENLSIEENILLITLMYTGRGDTLEGNYHDEHFYKLCDMNYKQWNNDDYLVRRMLGKAPFIDYLERAIEIYKKVEKLG